MLRHMLKLYCHFVYGRTESNFSSTLYVIGCELAYVNMFSQEANPMPMIVVSQFFDYLATALTLKLFRNTLALKLIASLENSINIKFYL